MLTRAFWTSLRILFFRASPEDFPYDQGQSLSRAALLLALLAFTALFALTLPLGAALASSAVAILSLWLVTRLTLRLRKLENRMQQTFNALLFTNALLTLLMVPPFARLAPAFLELFAQLKQHPELANQREHWPQPPLGASLLVDLLGLWQLVVCARIFGNGAGIGSVGGVALTLLSMLAMFVLLILATPFMALFLS